MPGDYYHPVFLDLRGKRVLIVGGGEIAAEKIRSLQHSGASITVVAPEAIECIRLWHHEGFLTWLQRSFEPEDVRAAFMSIGATDDQAVNREVADLAAANNRLGNSVDDPSHCNFIMAAIARSGSMQVAISSSGNSPALAQRVRDRILGEILTEDVGALADFLGAWRPEVGRSLPTYQSRRQFWESVLGSDIPAILARDGRDAADRAMRAKLSATDLPEASVGRVALVGAGPGNPGYLTVRAVQLLRIAEVVLYDRLVNPEILRLCNGRAECLCVGKSIGTPGRPRQASIHRMMIEHAKAGKSVVRLKGGDPFVFGRGGEELLALRDAGIAVEVVPGISSSVAAAGAAGIPVTHRGVANSFAVFTAQAETGDVDWDLASNTPTAVFLMGLEKLPSIISNLIAHGRSPETPVAVISDATLPTQTVAIGALKDIVERAMDLTSPATIVVGEVVNIALKSPAAR